MGIISEGVDLLKLVNKAQNVDLYIQLGNWIDKVADLQQEKEQLKTERDDLREKLRVKAALERIKGHVFIEGDDEEICPRCAEVDLRIVHLMSITPQKGGWPKATGPHCKTPTLNARPATRQVLSAEEPE